MGNLALLQSMVTVNETWIDYFIIGVYFVFVLGIGAVLRTKMQTSEDYFLSGRSLPSWITGLAFLGANLGALEIMGMGAGAATYGIMQAHYYWIGAIPAMVFVALFMIPFYYASRVHSVPGFLKLRYNEATRGFNAILFAIFMLLLSGINMFAMALVFQLLLGWSLTASIFLSAGIVLAYVVLGGLSSSIYNEVLQFFLITLGLVPLVIFGLIDVGGLSGLKESIGNPQFFHTWANTGTKDNPFAVQWFYIVFGLGLVQSFGYWCTDFLVVQRALAAEDLAASQRTPLIAAFPKLLYGVLAIFPGLIALSVLGPKIATAAEANNAVPYAMAYYFPTGMLGFGLTALLAAFMSGMAGNVTAFNTVWTYDIYKAYINRDATDRHYLNVGRIATVAGVLLSIVTAYLALGFQTIINYVQVLHGIFLAPLFGTFLLGMFWRRTTGWGGFSGLVAGTGYGIITYLITLDSGLGASMARAFFAWIVCLAVTIAVSLVTQPKPDDELRGLVWGLTEQKEAVEEAWYKKPWVLAVTVLAITVALNIYFW
ncbi:MAG TPA: sodium:solute symporter family protein [Rubrobacter sp.]|jgi:SSS family solute:Na+ symporter|nr:sodium:solute symporter family protein [Rubrobacter sp.]